MTINGVHTVNPPLQTIHYQILLAAYLHCKRVICIFGGIGNMALISYEDAQALFLQFHDPRDTFTCATIDCCTCDTVVRSTCTLLRLASDTKVLTEHYLTEAALLWKPFTDTICDTSKCMSCPDYYWCNRLREIYDEGVLCYDSSNPA